MCLTEENEEKNFKKVLESARNDLNFLKQQQKQIEGLISLCDHIAHILTGIIIGNYANLDLII